MKGLYLDYDNAIYSLIQIIRVWTSYAGDGYYTSDALVTLCVLLQCSVHILAISPFAQFT